MAEIDPRLLRAFERVVPGASESLSATAKMESVPGWDSLTYVQVMASIEMEFDITLSTLEAARMRSVPAICAVLAEHGVDIGGGGAADATITTGTDSRQYIHDPERRAGAPDPMPHLIERRDAIPVGPGRFVYSGPLLALMDGFDREFAAVADAMGATPQAYPTTVSTQSLIDAGYLKSFPHHAFFADTVGPEELTGLTDATGPRDIAIHAPSQVLAPTVCYHCFEALRDRPLDGPALFTASNPCHRHEPDARGDLARVATFHMRELIQFGANDDIEAMLDQALSYTAERLRRWDLAFRVETATDPFFAGAESDKARFQRLFGLKRELLVRLDHSGEWFAVASFNNHQDALVGAFRVGAQASGCVGWGLERLAYALMSRHGTEPGNWPSDIT